MVSMESINWSQSIYKDTVPDGDRNVSKHVSLPINSSICLRVRESGILFIGLDHYTHHLMATKDVSSESANRFQHLSHYLSLLSAS